MTLNLSMPGQEELKPRITVFGVGGAGGNAVNNMIEKQLDGCEFVVANTDAQALQQAYAENKIQLGVKVTEGLGAGARASVGAAAAEESIEQIVDHLAGAHMCFITAGMGGGTGTGAAPIIAQAARELGVLTVGVVTKPFQFEGSKRMRQAEEGVETLQKVVDTLIIIPNQNLFRLANEKTTFTEAFSMADDVLYQGVKGVTDLMVRPGLINLDFADVRAVMDEMGKAMMGTGEAEGEDRAIQAAEKAIANPLLDEISLRGAKGVLINITGSHDLTLFELDEAANRIREEVDPDANIIVGSTLDTGMEGVMRVSVVATGIDAEEGQAEIPVPRRPMSQPLKQNIASEAPKPAAEEQPAVAARAEAAPRNDQQPRPAPAREAAASGSAQAAGGFQGGYRPHAPALREDADEPALQDDGLPAPAYRPQVPEFEPRTETYAEAPYAEEGYSDDDYAAAPQAEDAAPAPVSYSATPGEPSPETMRRLQAAVSKAAPTPQRGRAAAEPARPQGQGQATGQGERLRFGINSLINRMTGHAGEQPGGQGAAPAPRQQPQPPRHRSAAAAAEPQAQREPDPDQERIEIPAFLRRQAN
ncbi:cell division protein FtsZ [Pontibaca methylaminivorans]|uniref:Cell division protein FtsZ n=1 Tax=Pontibaca methylaminivorans TaxID=515897 RepID=A0A1R3WGT5_9RHOB|nr:cell division protein FtsZ [Pontibaca methylaminivorans]SIT77118.1 cell division protein FtsZ [Pontibaca methylaminivorans]